MPLETSAESPVPVRTVLRLVGEWIGRLGRIWVEGQIAELTRRGAVVFLTLRDPVAAVSVRVICPRTVLDANEPAPGEGARVVVWAKPDFNINRGAFALTAIEIRAVGIGELLARLERLRHSLAAEGLFAAARKRPLLQNVAVQGTYAADEVTEALRRLDADRAVDVIIIARGGGSIEDLLPFSDESLIRAVAACQTPVVSAIGHEQDVPLLDQVADVRASTPTDAARRVVPDVAEQTELIAQLRARARRRLAGRLDRELAWLADIRSRPAISAPVREIERRQEQVLGLAQRARRCLSARLDRAADDIAHTRARLVALSPAATLDRGYAIVQRTDATVVRAATDVTDGETLTVRLGTGQLTATAHR